MLVVHKAEMSPTWKAAIPLELLQKNQLKF